MKNIFVFLVLIFLAIHTIAQPKTTKKVANSCKCENIKGNGISNERDAFSSAVEARKVFSAFLDFFPQFKGKISVLAVTCLNNPAKALICPENKNNIRYVLYDNDELNGDEITWFDQFVLAHELGHHVRNHFHDGSNYNPETSELILEEKKKMRYYNRSIVEELQADELAVYVIKKLGGNINYIVKKIESRNDEASSSHPSSKERSEFIKKCWNEIDVNQSFSSHSHKNFASEFHDKYNRTVYGLSVEVLAGYIMGNNSNFIKDNKIVNAALVSNLSSPAFTTGMRFSYININWPIRPEIETTYSKFKFVTLDDSKTNKIEDFNFEQINITPQATFNTLGLSHEKRTTIPRFGFTASVGYSLNIPLKYSYKNYYSNITALGIDNIKKIGNLTFAVGIERKPIRDELVKYYRLSLRYSPTSLGIKNLSNVSTKSNIISANLSFRLWK